MAQEILNQPLRDKIGDRLKTLLSKNDSQRFDTFHFLVAYVKVSGVNQLASAIQYFRQGGGEVRAVVGVNRFQKNTSLEGLQNLMPLCNEIWAYNNESANRTFHPKVYIFERVSRTGVVFVGSSNLTAGGLYTNYEANFCFEYDLKNPSDADKFASIRQMFEAYSTPSEFCRILTPAYLQSLDDYGYLGSEGLQSTRQSGDDDEETGSVPAKRKALFGSAGLSAPTTTRRIRRTVRSGIGVRRTEDSSVLLDAPVLIAEIPRAGNRWNQANFDLDTFRSFFQLQAKRNQSVLLFPVSEDGTVGEAEFRQSVSVVSQNYRIEVGLAANQPYPSQGRPIGVFLRVGVRAFRYRLVMPGSTEHSTLKSLLDSNWKGARRNVRRIQLPLRVFREQAKDVRL